MGGQTTRGRCKFPESSKELVGGPGGGWESWVGGVKPGAVKWGWGSSEEGPRMRAEGWRGVGGAGPAHRSRKPKPKGLQGLCSKVGSGPDPVTGSPAALQAPAPRENPLRPQDLPLGHSGCSRHTLGSWTHRQMDLPGRAWTGGPPSCFPGPWAVSGPRNILEAPHSPSFSSTLPRPLGTPDPCQASLGRSPEVVTNTGGN